VNCGDEDTFLVDGRSRLKLPTHTCDILYVKPRVNKRTVLILLPASQLVFVLRQRTFAIFGFGVTTGIK